MQKSIIDHFKWKRAVVIFGDGSLKSDRPNSGFFITLYDKDTLNLYLDRGIYGFLMRPEYGEIGRYSRHYAALADYACGRRGTHVFFFLKRRIHYGGQLIGSDAHGCFYLNGPFSPMGLKAKAELCWDESRRKRYEATDDPGVFIVKIGDDEMERCQPYLIQFKDMLDYQGRNILSDDLYDELGAFRHPLPSNTIQGMGFCTLTPGECDILLELMKGAEAPDTIHSAEELELSGQPKHFEAENGISAASEAENEAHLEASVLANPKLLPDNLAPKADAICRQVPVSPLKPYQMDRADICYYSAEQIEQGTLPNVLIELKNSKAGKGEIEQVVRYMQWLKRVAPDHYRAIKLYVYAPEFTKPARTYVPSEFRSQMNLVTFDQAGNGFDQLDLSNEFQNGE